MALRWVFTFLLFTPILVWAESSPELKLSEIVNKKRKPFNAQITAEWKWKLNKEKATELFIQAKITSPRFSSYKTVGAKGANTRGVLKGSSLIIRFKDVREIVVLKGSDQLLLEIALQNILPVIDKNCSEFKLTLKPLLKTRKDGKQAPTPLYLATVCGKTAEGVNLTVSYPESVTIGSSDIAESRGKGESWKYYELGPVKQAQESLGTFTFYYKNQEHKYVLEADKPTDGKTITSETILAGGLGFSMLNIKGFDITSSYSTPALILRVPFYPFLGNLGGAFDLDVAIPLGSTSTISYSQFSMFGAYRFGFSKFALTPKLGYMVFSQSDTTTGIGLATNQIAVALNASLRITSRSQVMLDFMMASFGAASISSHYSISLGYFADKSGNFGWGAGAKLQAFKATSSSSVERQFNSTVIFALLSF